MRAFLDALAGVHPTAPSWSLGWSAHEVAAHVAASAQERASLIEEHLAGKPTRPTRPFSEREPPFRELSPARLRDRLVTEAARFEAAVSAMDAQDTIEYSGWQVSGERLRLHSHSEAALHPWDLVGDDPGSQELLTDPRLTSHVLVVFESVSFLPEAGRWRNPPIASESMRLRTPGEPDVLIHRGTLPALVPSASDARHSN